MKRSVKQTMCKLFYCSMALVFGGMAAFNCVQPTRTVAEESKSLRNLFLYNEAALNTEENVDLSTKGLDTGKSGLLFTSAKTGDEAEGEKIGFKGILSGEFEIDFRVFSEKNYVARNAESTVTHTAIGWNSNLNQSTSCYAADEFNPYMDLKEVGIKFTSNTDASKWFVVYVHGGYAGLRADMASARVYTSADNEDWPYELKGYGLVGNDGWPSASWEPGDRQGANYTMLGTTFSNALIRGESTSAMIKFDPENMEVYGYNSGWGLVRDLEGNSKLSSSYNEWFGSLNSSDFVGGYTVELQFTDVTSNGTVGNTIVDKEDGYNEVQSRAYQTFDAPYDRYANMLLYSLKAGGVEYNMSEADSADGKTVVWMDEIKDVTTNTVLDMTPNVYNTKEGEKAYDGTITWKASDGRTGEIVAKDGKYSFAPTSYGMYLFTYSPMSDNSTSSFMFGVNVKRACTVTLKNVDGDTIKTETLLEGEKYTLEGIEEDGKSQIGWWYNGGLYPIGHQLSVNSDIELTICSINFTVSTQATLRTVKTKNFGYGMLFESTLDTALFDELRADGYICRYAYGYILPTDLIGETFTPTNDGLSLKLTYQDGKAVFGLTDLYEKNYTRDFSILAYFAVNYSDGTTAMITSKYDAQAHRFNIRDLAVEALKNESNFTADELSVIRQFAK